MFEDDTRLGMNHHMHMRGCWQLLDNWLLYLYSKFVSNIPDMEPEYVD